MTTIKDTLLTVDTAFPTRVFRMSLLIAAFGLVFSTGLRSFSFSLGLGVGMLVSLVSLWTLTGLSRIFLNAKEEGAKKTTFIGLTLFIKYPLLVLLLYYSLRHWNASPWGVALGVGLVPGVMVLKIVGILWVNRMNAANRGKRKGTPSEAVRQTRII